MAVWWRTGRSYSVALLEAGLLDPSEGETEEPSHVGRWRQHEGPDEPQAAVEKESEGERMNEYKPQRNAMPTAILRAGALRGVVPLHQRQPGARSAQGVEALEANEVSDDEVEAEYQEAVALTTIVKQGRAGKPQSSGEHKAELDNLEQKLPCAQCRHMCHWKDGHHCLATVKRVNWAGGSSKPAAELGTVSCVSGCCNLVNLKPLCGSNESLSHNFGPENSTCVVDICFYVPNLGGSVVSDCGDTRPASGTLGYVLGVGNTKQKFFCRLVSQIPSKSSFVGQKVLCWEPNLSASLCHFQHHTLIQSPLWMCALTGKRREIAWFLWTEHPHTSLFLDTFMLVHASHCGSRCRITCLHKKMFMHTS